MLTGILGGSFNPVHNGHLRLAEYAMDSFSLDRLIVIPSHIAPHKDSSDFVSDEHRLMMCRLAFSDMKKTEICDFEIEKGGVSYSIDTVHYLRQKYPDDRFYFIMGSDMLLSFETWKNYEELLSLTAIIAASRENDEDRALIDKKKELEALGGKIHILGIEPYVLSSTQIRHLIASGEDFSCYLPERVVKYIKDNKLYLE